MSSPWGHDRLYLIGIAPYVHSASCFRSVLKGLVGLAEVFVWGRGEYGRLGLGDRSGSSKLRATEVHFREPETRIVQVRTSSLSRIS